MAKTIYEMAVSYGKEHQGTVDIEVFEAGANAVLEVIEQFINDTSYKYLKPTLRGVIRELKGE